MSTRKNVLTAFLATVLTIGLAACGGGNDTVEPPDLTPVQGEAAAASTDAAAAAKAAEDEVAAQEANKAADLESFGAAGTYAGSARDAADDAAVAAREAAEATTLTGAEAARDRAREAQSEAEAERDNALKYAGMVADAHQRNLDEIQRMTDVDNARTAALASYKDADADAGRAEMAAGAAGATAPGSPGATTAREAADAARAAATAAKDAHDAITDDMTKAQADAQASEAATQAENANREYMTARGENDAIQTTSSQIAENSRQSAVADARKYGGAAVENAKESADAARAAANDAKIAYDNALAEYERARSARTNSAKANEYADAANEAYMEADAAADDAHEAYLAAKNAVGGVMDDSTKAVADNARDTAEEQEEMAADHLTTAMMEQIEAKDAEAKAMLYADDHVVGLLEMANAEHITTADDPDANLDETELDLIRKNINAHIANVNIAVKEANDDNPTRTTATTNPSSAPFHGGVVTTAGGVTASWHYYGDLGADNVISDAAAVTSDAANADTRPGEGKPVISVDPEGGGDAVALIHAGPGPDGNAGTDDDLEANFKQQDTGLGAFSHEKYFGRYNDAGTTGTVDVGDTYQRIILFTDLTQAKATVPAESVSLTNEPVSNASRVTPTAAPATTGNDIHDFAGTYDHDGNAATDPIAGTFDCVDPTTCRVTRSGTGNNGEHVAGQTKVTSISGYRFTGTGTTAEVLSMLDDTWLAFGVWLTETVAEGTNNYAFGAFADGGAAIGDDGEPTGVDSVTGTAQYEGKAAGVHSTDTAVDFFHGDVTLDADFDAGSTDSTGTITGSVHNIMAAGRPVGHDIELVVADPGAANPSPNIVNAGTFSGRARMMDTGVNDSSGEDVYRYTGGWSGTFYNHMANDTDTANVDESTRAPGSVAGTFGVGNVNESYVGAFGAHCTGGNNCNPHD